MAGMSGILWGHKISEGTRVLTSETDRVERMHENRIAEKVSIVVSEYKKKGSLEGL